MRRRIIHLLEDLFIMTFRFLSPVIPNRCIAPLGRILGALFFNLVPPARRHVLNRLRDGFPEKSEAQIRGMFQETVRNGGEVWFEQVMFNRKLMAEELYRIKGLDTFDAIALDACKRERGMIVLACHIGNWEKLMGIVAHRIRNLVNRTTYVIMARMPTPYIDRLATFLRTQILKCGFVYVKRSRFFIDRILKDRDVLMLGTDVDFQYRGVFVPFMNRLVSTGRGPAHYAITRNVPLVFVVMYSGADRGLQIHTEEIEVERTGDAERDVYDLTARLAEKLEDWVRKVPEQWFGWLQDPWKTRPIEELEARLRKDPGNADIMESIGQYCLAMRRKEDAREMFRRALDADPQSALAHSESGRLLLNEGAVEEGIFHLFRALEICPKHFRTLLYAGRFLMERGLYKSAMGYFKRAARVKYDDPESYWGMGKCLEGLERRREAVDMYRKGLRRDDDYAPLHLALAEIYASQPDRKDLLAGHLDVLEMLQAEVPPALLQKARS